MNSVNFAQPDVTLRLDLSGVIRRATLSSTLSEEGVDSWVGRPWAETVAEGGNAQVRQMIEDARQSGVSFFHQVRQRFPSGLELALEYTTVRLGGGDGLLAIGRNLEAIAELRSRLIAAQRSMERDYWKLREVETRYRLLFDASTQPVLLIGADDTRILEANPAAIRALGVTSDRELLPEILAAQREAFRAMLARVRDQGKAPGIVVHLGPDRQPWLVRGSLIAAEPAPVFLLQLSPGGMTQPAVDKRGGVRVEEIIDRLPQGFVVLDAGGKILRTNPAFLDLIEQPEESAVLGEPIGRWMPLAGADAGALLGSLQPPHAISRLATTIRGEFGTETEVEVTVAGSRDKAPRHVGLLLHRSCDGDGAPSRSSALPQADLVGTKTLHEIVQETVATVERRCIEAALGLTKGNRTVAAEMLGLSRQSLYAKLRRYASLAEAPADPERKARKPRRR